MFKTLTKDFILNPPLEMNVDSPTDEIILWGKPYRMYKDEWKHHVHLKCTNKCDANCNFCIERSSRKDKEDACTFVSSAKDLLRQLHEQSMLFTVSLTGGEPTLFPLVNETIELANSFPLKLFSMNTNGRFLDQLKVKSFNGWVNISKHSIHDGCIMSRKWEVTPDLVAMCRKMQPNMKVRFQCVLGVEKGLQTIPDIEEFMAAYSGCVDDFSFRSLIIEEAEGKVPTLFNDFRHWLFNNEWCVEQTIQDYYVYEVFNPPKMKPITISWANMGLLQRYNESHEDNFLEEIIVHPDGMVSGSWNRKSLIIYQPKKETLSARRLPCRA